MQLRLYNTERARVEPFEPIEPGHARVYVCGPTVYDHAHVGHMRSALTYDVLVRHLRAQGLRVTFVRNITDVDDKILKRAAERGEAPGELAKRYEQSYRDDAARLALVEPEHQPRVTEHMPEIMRLIGQLIERGAAYTADGDVYFAVQSFPAYGRLSHRKQEDLSYGASGRLDDQERKRKRHPADFALWKGSAAPDADDLAWDSPWGRGRPGWHIECSAMAMRYLGESLDLHGGGLDLVFPHHENEIAQAEAATGKPYTRLWMHHGFVESNREKMSKSLGNFLTARDCFRLAEPEALRYLMYTVHYRAPLALDWDTDAQGVITGCAQIDEAERRVEYVYRTRERLDLIPAARIVDAAPLPDGIAGFAEKLAGALDDDLNTPIALAVSAEFLKHVNELAETAKTKQGKVGRAAIAAARDGFDALARVLALGADQPTALLDRIRARRAERLGLKAEEVERQIAARKQARSDRDFARADAIRDEIAARGIELMDGPDGTTWRIP